MKKIKLGNALLPLNLAVIILVLVIHLLPDITALRVIFGLPFLLLFPGYTLILALFPRKGEMDGIERIALSFGLSFAVSALIGLGLNYTPWGIRLLPVLYAISLFVFLMSAIAIWRQHRLPRRAFQHSSSISVSPGVPANGTGCYPSFWPFPSALPWGC